MSYDLYFWSAGATDEPGPLADRLADEEADGLVGDERVLAFRAELLRRWPELADMVAPWHRDLGWRQARGRTDLADRFVGLTLPLRWKDTAELPALANAHGLDCHDGQAGELLRAGPGSDQGERPSGPATRRCSACCSPSRTPALAKPRREEAQDTLRRLVSGPKAS